MGKTAVQIIAERQVVGIIFTHTAYRVFALYVVTLHTMYQICIRHISQILRYLFITHPASKPFIIFHYAVYGKQLGCIVGDIA